MSKPRYRWWGYAKAVIRAYPARCQELADLHAQAVTAAYGNTAHGAGASRTTESLALRELPRVEQKEYEAVRSAIEETLQTRFGDLKIELIRAMFWDGARLDAAAYRARTSERTAKRWHRDFIFLVGLNLGLVD